MRLLLLAPFALLLASCDLEHLSDANREFEDFSFDFPLSATGRLSLENYNGSVEITAWDQEKVEVRGSKYASTKEQLADIRVDARAVAPDQVTIRTIPPTERRGNTGARYTIRLPRRAMLERIASSNGGIRVDGFASSGRIQTSNGTIRVGQHQGSLDLSTSNGAIEMQNVNGPVTARTSNGRITVDEMKGALDAGTSNGSITATLLEPPSDRPLRFSTTNGSVDVTVRQPLRSELRANTSNGGVTLRLPADTQARVSASTSNSTITNEFQLSGSDASVTKRRVEGRIGNGGPTIDISTSNGSIRLLKSGV
jgi:hypothetical protein